MRIHHHTILICLVLSALLLTSCSDPTTEAPVESGAVAVEDIQSGEIKWIDPNKLQQGPIQRDSLTAEQMDRIAALRKVFVEIDGQTIDQWTDNFKRDLNPDSELAIWERIANAYSSYCDKHEKLTLETKKEVYKVALLRSMTSADEVIARLKLASLTEQDAREIMAGF
ncbi:hypothetical protein N9Y42_05955 [Mariniblastus sp.]|nr:hypothetical protein [Mariniblastus sp.]